MTILSEARAKAARKPAGKARAPRKPHSQTREEKLAQFSPDIQHMVQTLRAAFGKG
jgi:hypothetical protein